MLTKDWQAIPFPSISRSELNVFYHKSGIVARRITIQIVTLL
jgi:hypothetical protein